MSKFLFSIYYWRDQHVTFWERANLKRNCLILYISTAILFKVCLIEIHLKRRLPYICVSCTSCRWQVACSVWWISTILYTSDIRNANISFPPKTTFPEAYVYLHTLCYLAGTSFAHPSASNFPSEWKTFASCFCDIQEKLHCQILIFSCQKFQHKHR